MAEIKKVLRKFVGEVASTKMAKTIVVKVTTLKWHTKYHKQYKVTTRYKVHDEKQEAKVGQTVEFVECRPLSRDKRWRLSRIIK
jgi:small subunit ribosomal protein S17